MVSMRFPPIALIFGPFDPTGAGSLPADAVTLAQAGVHALSALTASLVCDSAGTEELHPVSPDFLNEQARCLLEDMPVKALKVGPLYSIESISVVAQIVSDYPKLPLVLQLSRQNYASLADELSEEEMQFATLELLLPLADLVVIQHAALTHWALDDDRLAPGTPQLFLKHGASHTLTVNAPLGTSERGYILHGKTGPHKQWAHPDLPSRLLDSDGLLASLITAEFAKEYSLEDAINNALQAMHRALQQTFQPGMGHLFFNRTLETTLL